MPPPRRLLSALVCGRARGAGEKAAVDSLVLRAFLVGAPISAAQQNAYAQSLYTSLSRGTGPSGECSSALRRLACVLAFPKCPSTGSSLSSVSYFTPCRLQCEQVNARCQAQKQQLSLDCSGYSVRDCFLYVPSGFFVLPPAQGPYTALPSLYSACLAVWLSLTLLWYYWSFVVFRDTSLLFCRAVAGIPAIKCVVLIFATAYWSTCVAWDMCSFWMSVSLVNTHLVFETAQVVLFLLISKGWRVTRSGFPSSEWRGIIMAMSGFYMGNSIITVLQGGVLTGRGFWIASAVLYGLMYAYIVRNTARQLRTLSRQVGMLQNRGQQALPEQLTAPLRKKFVMFVCFLVLVLASACIEVLAHALAAENGKIWLVLVAYEVSNLVILGTIGWIFRPREHSPFFFMVPARQGVAGGGANGGQPNIPFLDVAGASGGAGDDEFDCGDNDAPTAVIELTSLIQQTPGAVSTAIGGTSPHQMIVLTEPSSQLSSKWLLGLR